MKWLRRATGAARLVGALASSAAAPVPLAPAQRAGPQWARAVASGGCPARVRRLALFFCASFWPLHKAYSSAATMRSAGRLDLAEEV